MPPSKLDEDLGAGSPHSFNKLRKRADKNSKPFDRWAMATKSRAEAQALVEQFYIQKAQLELQNEELRRVQADLEASRERYFDLYDLAPVGYITLNSTGSVVESNLRAASLFRVTHSVLNGRSFLRLVAGVDSDNFYLAHRRLLQSGAPQVCEIRLRRQDGPTFWARLEMSLSRNSSRADLDACRIVIIDITDRKLAEQRFDAFMVHTPAVASIVDEAGRYVYVNPALQRYTGRSAEAWLGQTFFDVWPNDVARHLDQQHSQALRTGQVVSGTETLPLGTRERINQVLRFAFQGPNGQTLVGSVSIDVTERHHLESALREANVQLAAEKNIAEQATKAKSQFLSAMTHEIRTPLNGVIGMVDLLLPTELTAEQYGYARMAADSAELLLSLVNDILDLSKIEAGKLELDRAPLDLESLVEDALSLICFKAREKSLELAARYRDGAPRHFFSDPGRLRQILMNLLANAVKFTQSGHVLVEVDASAPVDGFSKVRLAVHDTGVGISSESLSHLFTPFSQGDTTIAGRYGGSGLGLSIVKQVAELMGGEVGAASLEGTGSTFYCDIPLQVQDQQSAASSSAAERLRNVAVLIVGSQGIGRSVTFEWCCQWGMNAVQCDLAQLPQMLADAKQKNLRYQMLIASGLLPELRETLRHVRADEAGNPPKIILTVSDLSERSNDLDADVILSTPVRRRVLCDTLSGLNEPFTAGVPPVHHFAHAYPLATVPKVGLFKVLVTDDNAINRTLTQAMLAKMGCDVDTANDGRAAVEKVAEHSYDLVLMDCVMPVMDGFSATQTIRALAKECAKIPIVALTASATNEDRERCLAAGMNDFLAKPIRSEQLAKCLTRWLPKT